jgi:hypothetical protein
MSSYDRPTARSVYSIQRTYSSFFPSKLSSSLAVVINMGQYGPGACLRFKIHAKCNQAKRFTDVMGYLCLENIVK